MVRALIIIALATATLMGPAQAQIVANTCSDIDEAVSTPGSVPDKVLVAPDSTECLVRVLERSTATVTFPDPPPDERDRLNRTVAALNRQIEMWDIDAINEIRKFDDTSIASMLAFGATSEDRPTRLNAGLLLVNVVDNSTVCVVMDHLADPALAAGTDVAYNGRMNLISVVSVVAPWATQSNYKNMRRLIPYMRDQLSKEKDMSRTSALLDLFEQRLDFQVNMPGRFDDEDLASCRAWKPIWGDQPGFHIDYGYTETPAQ